ncbi:MAG: hypothetical protein PHH93_03170 [Prolixibacteraceae bacterium]|nr:hypothetical protein [Prolixibacteraceae bacterium]
MKSIYYIIMILAGAIFLNGCETDTNGPMPDTFEEGGVAYMIMDATTSGIILPGDLDAVIVEGSIDVLYEPVFDKLTLMVAYNGDHNNAGVLVDNITSVPHDFSVDIDDVIAVLPQLNSRAEIDFSDYFTFYVNMVIGGKVYPVFMNVGGKEIRTVGSGIITNIKNLEDENAITDLRIDVPCEYVVEDVTGNYRAVSPPSDWAVAGNIVITPDENDPYILYVSGLPGLDGLNEDGSPLKMIVSPVDFTVVAEKTVLASDAWGYTNYYFMGSGRLNTCTGTYTMTFTIAVDQGSFGEFGFTFTKQ